MDTVDGHRGLDVFISHANSDRDAALELAAQLRPFGLEPWVALTDVVQGQWRIQVEEAIDRAPVFLLLVSSQTTNSIEVENEFRRARRAQKTILVALIEPCALPLYASSLQYVDWPDGSESGVQSIVRVCQHSTDLQRAGELAYLAKVVAVPWASDEYTPLTLSYEQLQGSAEPFRLDELVSRVLVERSGRPYALSTPSQAVNLAEALDASQTGSRARIALVGDPGAGKTTTLAHIAVGLAERAAANVASPIPVAVSLSNYSGRKPLLQHVRENSQVELGSVGSSLEALAGQGRLALLLDGLNEMPQYGDPDRLHELRKFLSRYSRPSVVISCRRADYSADLGLELDVIGIRPLTPLQIRHFIASHLHDYPDKGETLFWRLTGEPRCRTLFERFRRAGGSEYDFWISPIVPEGFEERVPSLWALWSQIRDNPLSLMALCRNPYMLSMLVRVYRAGRGVLPTSAHELFSVFVRVLVADERARRSNDNTPWIEVDQQEAALTAMATAMRQENLSVLSSARAAELLGSAQMLQLGTSEKLLAGTEAIGFAHQLLQEFFASNALERHRLAGRPVEDFFPAASWWERSGWEEALVLLAGRHSYAPVELLDWISNINPEITARCILEAGVTASERYLSSLADIWLHRMTNPDEPILGRAAIGRAMGRIDKDDRPGVVSFDEAGIPVVDWVRVPRVSYSSAEVPGVEYDFFMSRYPVTNAHFAAFIEDDGYTHRWDSCWTAAGQAYREVEECPLDYTDPWTLPNHPRIGVTWYEALAFSHWLTVRSRQAGLISDTEEIRLPTEPEWQRAARGPNGTDYPWGEVFDYALCNIRDIRSTTAVGIYPDGASPEGVFDLVGNCWEWCLTKWSTDPRQQDNSIEGTAPRVYRGGSWAFDFAISTWRPEELRSTCRHWIVPEDEKPDAIGIRLVRGAAIRGSQ